MNISQQLKTLRDALAAWAREHGGSVKIVAKPSELASVLALKPGSVRVVLLWDSETKRGDFEETGRVDRKFKAVVSTGVGLKADRSEGRLDGAAGGESFYDLIEECREVIRATQVESAEDIDETITDFQSMSRFELEGVFTDDAQIDFSIATQLPLPQLAPEE